MRRLLTLVMTLALFATAVPTTLAQDGDDDTEPTQPANIATFIRDQAESENPEFVQLLAAVRAADAAVLEALANPDATLTVFAPTDAAFEALRLQLGNRPMDELLDDATVTAGIMLYHVLADALTAADLASLLDDNGGFVTLPTLQGQYLDVADAGDGLFIDGVAEIMLDIDTVETGNGIVHVIDTVLLPEAATLLELLRDTYTSGDAPQFSYLNDVLNDDTNPVATVLNALDTDITLFLPLDSAFDALASDGNLEAVLQAHAVVGHYGSAEVLALLADADSVALETLAGTTLTLTFDDGTLRINDDITVLATDVDAVNGIFHVIDGALAADE